MSKYQLAIPAKTGTSDQCLYFHWTSAGTNMLSSILSMSIIAIDLSCSAHQRVCVKLHVISWIFHHISDFLSSSAACQLLQKSHNQVESLAWIGSRCPGFSFYTSGKRPSPLAETGSTHTRAGAAETCRAVWRDGDASQPDPPVRSSG